MSPQSRAIDAFMELEFPALTEKQASGIVLLAYIEVAPASMISNEIKPILLFYITKMLELDPEETRRMTEKLRDFCTSTQFHATIAILNAMEA